MSPSKKHSATLTEAIQSVRQSEALSGEDLRSLKHLLTLLENGKVLTVKNVVRATFGTGDLRSRQLVMRGFQRRLNGVLLDLGVKWEFFVEDSRKGSAESRICEFRHHSHPHAKATPSLSVTRRGPVQREARPQTPRKKRLVRYFLSYSSKDQRCKEQLLEALEPLLAACKDYDFHLWKDGDLLSGELWHKNIQQAITECDMGLLLLSVDFLGSDYIKEHELPHFLQGKDFIPVGLVHFPMEHIDLLGLEEHQIFRWVDKNGVKRSFNQLTSKVQRNAFAAGLFTDMVKRAKKQA